MPQALDPTRTRAPAPRPERVGCWRLVPLVRPHVVAHTLVWRHAVISPPASWAHAAAAVRVAVADPTAVPRAQLVPPRRGPPGHGLLLLEPGAPGAAGQAAPPACCAAVRLGWAAGAQW